MQGAEQGRIGTDWVWGWVEYTHACSPLPPSAVGIDCEKSATLGKQGETSSRRNISLYPNLIKLTVDNVDGKRIGPKHHIQRAHRQKPLTHTHTHPAQ